MLGIRNYVRYGTRNSGLPSSRCYLRAESRRRVGLVIHRLPTMMELYIETLTGTAFELRVSPFETVISVKAKIQRLEGIPISQQHLIWQSTELDDESCLHDYDIHSGATLKLVLAMRGGPINTRRIPTEDPTLREMAEYMEANRDDIMDKLPSGGSSSAGRQVTLLVFREGDQLNFFRVVDRGDGTLTPLPESLSAASMYNLCDEEEEAEPPTQEKEEENNRIRDKVQSLRSKMVDLSVGKQLKRVVPDGQQPKPMQPVPPSTLPPPRTTSGRPRPLSLRGIGQQDSAALFGSSLPPVVSGDGSDSRVAAGYGALTGSSWLPAAATTAIVPTEAAATRYPHPPIRSSAGVSSLDTPLDGARGGSSGGGGGSGSTLPQLRAGGRSLSTIRSSSGYTRSVTGLRSAGGSEVYGGGGGGGAGYPPSIPEYETLEDSRRLHQQQQQQAATAAPLARERRRSSHRNSFDRLREPTWLPQPLPPAPSQAAAAATAPSAYSATGVPWQATSSSDDDDRSADAGTVPRQAPPAARRVSSSRRRAAAVARELAESSQGSGASAAGRLALESLSSSEAQAVAAGLLQQASHLERLGTSTIGGGGGTGKVAAGRRALALPLVDDTLAALSPAAAAESAANAEAALSARLLSHLTSSDGDDLSSQLLPPVKPQKKGSSTSRCFACSKKTGLATSYSCRCGNNFCATHRYAELHDCTFDYKTEGRKLLEQSNPVVSAPKLPKI